MSSLGSRLYERAPVVLQNALISAYAWNRRRKRAGGRYRAYVADAAAVWHSSEAAMRDRQLAKLQEIVRHAAERVPFYRDRFAELGVNASTLQSFDDLRRLPVLDKDTVRRHNARFAADNVLGAWTNETSGSTGTPLTVRLSADAYQLTMALLTWHEMDHGIRPGSRYATFAGRLVQPVSDDRPPFWRTNWAERQLLCSAYHLSDKNLPLYLQALESFQPVELIGYPSAIATVASFCRRTGARPRLQLTAIVTNSETLFDWQRDVIEEIFRAPVFDYYGTAEAVAFAGQCTAKRYHPHPLMGFSEVLDDRDQPVAPGRSGRLVATTLCNLAMPLIRYDTGDVVTRSVGACPCGRPGDTWDRVVGRLDDVVVTPDGHEVGRLDHIFKGVTNVREAQIAQTHADRLEIRVVPDPGYSQATGDLLVRNARERVGPKMRIDLVIVAAIPRTSRGKFRGVVKETGTVGPPATT